MPLIDEVGLPGRMTEFLDELDHPVKVVQGLYRQRPIDLSSEFTPENAAELGMDLGELRETGVVVVDWGSASSTHERAWHALPDIFYDHGEPRDLSVREILVPQADMALARPYSLSDDGFVLAEVGHRVVWYMTHLRYMPDPEHLQLDLVFGEPIRMSLDPTVADDLERIQKEANERAFLTAMTSGVSERRLRGIRDEINMAERSLRQTEQQLGQWMRTLADSKARLEAAEAAMTKTSDQWLVEYRQIERHEKVERVMIRDNRFVVYTTHLTLHDPDDWERTAPLGKFEISLDTESQHITINNLTGQRRDRDHPHVSGGEPCFGGHSSEILKLLADFEIGALIEVLISYLETFNPDDDWGRYATWWFEHQELTS